MFSLMPNPKCGPFDLKALRQDSLRRALFARAFGKMLHLDEDDDPFAAALLQDMAVPLLAKEAPEVYRQLLLTAAFRTHGYPRWRSRSSAGRTPRPAELSHGNGTCPSNSPSSLKTTWRSMSG